MRPQTVSFTTLRRRLARTATAALTLARRIAVFLVWMGAGVLGANTFAADPGEIDVNFGPYGTGAGYSHGHLYDFRALDGLVLPDNRIVTYGACPSRNVSPAQGTFFCLATWTAEGGPGDIYVFTSGMSRVSASSLGAIARQPDGKFVLAAPCESTAGTPTSLCLMRVNANFTQDTNFATGFADRTARTSYFTSGSIASSVAVQPDGKILVAGFCGTAPGIVMCVARFLANGSVDTSFGDPAHNVRFFTGVVASPIDRVKSIIVRPTGQIIVGGDCRNTDNYFYACVGRLNADGTIDTTLNSGSTKPLVLQAMGATDDFISEVVTQANGHVVWAGHCTTSPSSVRVPCLLRASLEGPGVFAGSRFDGASTPSHVKILEPAGSSGLRIERLLMQADGKMLVMLRDDYVQQNLTGRISRIRRYNEDGSIDENWRQPQIIWQYNTARPAAIGQQSDGRVILMGSTDDTVRIFRIDNLPSAGRNCGMDIDGDGVVSPTTDGLLFARAAAGMTGTAVTNGAIGPNAIRNNWTKVRDYLFMQCGMSNLKP